MGPLPRTANGKLYILVAIDYMTRWVEAQSVAKVNEKTVSKFVYTHICCRFGTPLEIVSDNGPGFRRGLLTEVCEELKISHRHSTPYYPQSNGLVEKANGIIAGIIRKMVESKPKRWDNFLDGAIWAYRTTYRDATQFTPFHLTPQLGGVRVEKRSSIPLLQKKALQLKDKLNEGIKDKEIKEKSLVLRYNNALDNRFDAKFERRWEGPFIVKKAFTGGYYQLMDLNGKEHPRKVNGYRLKPYLSRILPAVFETKQVSKKTKKLTQAGELKKPFASINTGKRSLEEAREGLGAKRLKLIIIKTLDPPKELVPIEKKSKSIILTSSPIKSPAKSPASNYSFDTDPDMSTKRTIMIKKDKLQALQKQMVKGKFVVDTKVNLALTYIAPITRFIPKKETVKSITNGSIIAMQEGWNTIVQAMAQMMKVQSNHPELLMKQLDLKRLYEQSMEDNGIQFHEAIDGFDLIVVLELRTQIAKLQTQQGIDWQEFNKALKEEYFLEDSQQIMKHSFINRIN
ncbi:hypothetical protein L7F22_028563 [Adiantum nelumboides]|nr:hypothetical protein [Adiantum nelumboides]